MENIIVQLLWTTFPLDGNTLPLDEFPFKGMRTWGQSRLHLVVFVYVVNQEY